MQVLRETSTQWEEIFRIGLFDVDLSVVFGSHSAHPLPMRVGSQWYWLNAKSRLNLMGGAAEFIEQCAAVYDQAAARPSKKLRDADAAQK